MRIDYAESLHSLSEKLNEIDKETPKSGSEYSRQASVIDWVAEANVSVNKMLQDVTAATDDEAKLRPLLAEQLPMIEQLGREQENLTAHIKSHSEDFPEIDQSQIKYSNYKVVPPF